MAELQAAGWRLEPHSQGGARSRARGGNGWRGQRFGRRQRTGCPGGTVGCAMAESMAFRESVSDWSMLGWVCSAIKQS